MPDGRRLLDAGVTVALASDCNPGTSYTTSIPWCIALATREMGMTVDEAVWAATLGGARALRETISGSSPSGHAADLVVLDAPSHLYLAYRPGVPLVAGVWRGPAGLGGTASPTAFKAHLIEGQKEAVRLDCYSSAKLVGVIELQPKLVQLFTVKEQLLIGAHVVIVDGVVHEILFLPSSSESDISLPPARVRTLPVRRGNGPSGGAGCACSGRGGEAAYGGRGEPVVGAGGETVSTARVRSGLAPLAG